MGLYPSQTALVIRCCVHERESTTDLLADTSDDDERKETVTPTNLMLCAHRDVLPCAQRDVLPRSLSTRTTLPIQ